MASGCMHVDDLLHFGEQGLLGTGWDLCYGTEFNPFPHPLQCTFQLQQSSRLQKREVVSKSMSYSHTVSHDC
jgi:hypothetical protein